MDEGEDTPDNAERWFGYTDKDMLNEFYQYWVEHSANAKKLRFEKEKVWGLERRLSTWHKNKLEKELKNSKVKPPIQLWEGC